MSRCRRRSYILALAAATLAAVPLAATAQGAGRGFLFAAPVGTFTVRSGWSLPSAHSDLFAFTTEQLTLDRGDFSSPALDADLAFRIRTRTDVVVSASIAGMRKQSEFRDFVDNNQQPIEQTTHFQRLPVTIGLKRYLSSTGRSIGRFAWIPARGAAYVGVGAGAMWYQFRQNGDFIDFETMDVFYDRFESEGWTPTANGMAGVDYSLGSRLALTAEARYVWAKAALSRDFSGFQRLDLSGFSTTAGLTVRF